MMAISPSDFELQPTLSGELLVLRPLLATDFEALYAAASDPLIWEQHPQRERYRREVFEGFFAGALASGGALVAIDRATGEIIGSSRYYDLDPAAGRVVIGYTFLTRKCWGGKFNPEMKALMLVHAFRFVDEVHFQIGARNLRSRRAIERIGAEFLREVVLDDVPHVIYRIGVDRSPSFG